MNIPTLIAAIVCLGCPMLVIGAVCLIDFPQTSPYNAWKSYATRTDSLYATLTFDQFLSYYKIAPQEWRLDKLYAFHKAEDKQHIFVVFNHKDFKRYQKFYTSLTSLETKGQKALIAQVQEDIDAARKIILDEREQASKELEDFMIQKENEKRKEQEENGTLGRTICPLYRSD